MNPLKKFWASLEDIPGSTASLVEWRFRLGAEFACAQPFLIPTDKRAASIPTHDDPYVRYRIVEHSSNDIVGIRQDDHSEIRLAKTDILIYRLNWPRLVRVIATVFTWPTTDVSADVLPNTPQIGTFRPFAGYAFPVYLTIPHESADLTHAVEAISARSETAFIVMAPTLARLRPACELLLRNRKACFLPISESIALNSAGQWVDTSLAAQRLAAFQQSVIPEASKPDDPAFFATPADATWDDVRIRFIDGETVSISVQGVAGRFLYSDIGMGSRKDRKPTKQWELLRSFARSYGALTWSSSGADRKNQKRRELLSKNLQEFFRIAGDPITLTRDKKGWRTLFTIEPDA